MACIFRVSSPVEMDKVELRGYPETQQQRRAYIKQHPCGNERQDDRMERAY
jgi:hypothetical protein